MLSWGLPVIFRHPVLYSLGSSTQLVGTVYMDRCVYRVSTLERARVYVPVASGDRINHASSNNTEKIRNLVAAFGVRSQASFYKNTIRVS